MAHIYIDGFEIAKKPRMSDVTLMQRVRVMLAHHRNDEALYTFYLNAYNALKAKYGGNAA